MDSTCCARLPRPICCLRQLLIRGRGASCSGSAVLSYVSEEAKVDAPEPKTIVFGPEMPLLRRRTQSSDLQVLRLQGPSNPKVGATDRHA
ncbi:ThiF family [Musa troglodytarum]|uniref:ThiF family n=1 Tax=Musa troglodytarum TaxID=320322 RepID=A0A9E7FBA7_9LILI|nr:ThiF family [Musa troglodytarum]